MKIISLLICVLLYCSSGSKNSSPTESLKEKVPELQYQYSNGYYPDSTFSFSKIGDCRLSGDTLHVRLLHKESRLTRSNLFLWKSPRHEKLLASQEQLDCVYDRHYYEPIEQTVELPTHFEPHDTIRVGINATLTFEDTLKHTLDTLSIWGYTDMIVY